MTQNGYKQPKGLTILIVIGITLIYAMQVGLSPLLTTICEDLGITSEVWANMIIDIVFVGIAIGSLLGSRLLMRCGTYRLYTLSMAACAGSLLAMLWVPDLPALLLSRVAFGLGFGFGVPFIGAAIASWYSPEQREIMNTLNALFPFIANLLMFALIEPIQRVSGLGWRGTSALWGGAITVILLLWLTLIRPAALPAGGVLQEASMREVWRSGSLRLLTVTFVCDFCCYAYVGIVLPTIFQKSGAFSGSSANIMAALLFPAIGILGCAAGSILMRRSHQRKPYLVAGQIFKLLGLTTAALLGGQSAVLLCIGVALYGFGNGFWIPAMYCVPMEMPDMTPERVAAAFSLMTAAATVFGFVAPTVGGGLTQRLCTAGLAADRTAALRYSLLLFGLLNGIGAACMRRFPDTRKNA